MIRVLVVDDQALVRTGFSMILGAEPDAFDAYDRGIAAEHRGKVPAWLFRANRRRFLKALLGRPRIYLSDFFHDRYDARARANLRRAVNARR